MKTDSDLTDATTAHPGVLPGEHLHALGARLHGDLILPDDAEWDAARRAWILSADQRPAAIVVAADEHDVAETVRSARKLGLRVAPQGTGHAAGALPPLGDAILLRTTRLADVTVDPHARTVRVGAGAVWGDVVAAAGGHGLAAVCGMSPTVGVAGFTLGGGLGWLARSHGLGSQSLRAVEGVDARGERVRADATRNPDLLWAARGGSLPLVVTALELQLHSIAELWAGGLLWPIERTAEVVHAWRAWSDGLPDTVTTLVRVLRYPPIPEIPEAVRGRAFVGVEAAVAADAESVAALLAPLRALEPELDSVRPMAPAELGSVHGDPVDPVPAYGDGLLLAELSAEAVEAFVRAALAPESGPLLSIEIRLLGGAVTPGRDASVDGVGAAVDGLDGAALVHAVGITPAPEAREAVRAAAEALRGALAPYASDRSVKTFAERPADPAALYGDRVGRIRSLAEAWDPERLILTGHPLG
ncbi:FAD-binding oxidoreductase [Microbacterium sp. MMO-10]|uniref:FAD-binding oxidoreductase n=1 Tax=Microbacterium sp. MMO-10 TaxID=3081272 RepID=UPI003019AA98